MSFADFRHRLRRTASLSVVVVLLVLFAAALSATASASPSISHSQRHNRFRARSFTSASQRAVTHTAVRTVLDPTQRQSSRDKCPVFIPHDVPAGSTVVNASDSASVRLSSSFSSSPSSSSSSSSTTSRRTTSVRTPRVVDGLNSPASLASILVLLTTRSGVCTGVLLAPQLMLTGAHCLRSVNISAFRSYSLRVSSLNSSRMSVDAGAIDAFRLHPQFTDSFGNSASLRLAFDVAWIRLRNPVPNASSRAFPLVNTNPDVPAVSSAVRVAGFGTDSYSGSPTTNSDGFVQPRDMFPTQADLPIPESPSLCRSYYSAGSYNSTSQVCVGVDPYDYYGYYSTALECTPCNMDAGGPILQYQADGTPLLVGLLTIDRSDSYCSSYPTVHMRASNLVADEYGFLPDLDAENITLADPSYTPPMVTYVFNEATQIPYRYDWMLYAEKERFRKATIALGMSAVLLLTITLELAFILFRKGKETPLAIRTGATNSAPARPVTNSTPEETVESGPVL